MGRGRWFEDITFNFFSEKIAVVCHKYRYLAVYPVLSITQIYMVYSSNNYNTVNNFYLYFFYYGLRRL